MNKPKIDPEKRWHKCRECNFKNKLSINLKYHMNCHSRNQKVKCPLCSFTGKSKFYVARHLKLHHLNIADSMPTHPEYLQEINYIIETLLEINEKQSGSTDGSNCNALNLVNQELENAEMSQSKEPERGESINKCTPFPNYSTNNPANIEVQDQSSGNGFNCTLCNYSFNIKFDLIGDMNHNHQYSSPNGNQENHKKCDSHPESYLQNKGIRIDPKRIEIVNLSDDDDEPVVCNCVNAAGMSLLQQKQFIESKERKLGIEEAECRQKISKCKEEIHMLRIVIEEMRVKIKQKREIQLEKKKKKEIVSHCLELIRINNQKLTDQSIENKKLEIVRTHIKDTQAKKLKSEIQLRALQLEELKTKRNLYETQDETVIIFESNIVDAIKNFKSNIKRMENELQFFKEEERVLTRDLELLNQRLNVVVKIPDHVLQGLQLEIGDLQKEIETSLQDEIEDVFNQQIISLEEKIRNLFEMKNNLLEIMFLKNSIRKNTDGLTQKI